MEANTISQCKLQDASQAMPSSTKGARQVPDTGRTGASIHCKAPAAVQSRQYMQQVRDIFLPSYIVERVQVFRIPLLVLHVAWAHHISSSFKRTQTCSGLKTCCPILSGIRFLIRFLDAFSRPSPAQPGPAQPNRLRKSHCKSYLHPIRQPYVNQNVEKCFENPTPKRTARRHSPGPWIRRGLRSTACA